MVYLADGLGVKECAARMDLSPRTVETHKSRLMKKLGVHSSVDLASLAASEGLLKQ